MLFFFAQDFGLGMSRKAPNFEADDIILQTVKGAPATAAAAVFA